MCLVLLIRKKSILNVASGFVVAGILVPIWYFTFKEHTIAHPWMTAKLLSLFAGLGMSAAITMATIYWRLIFADAEMHN